MLPKCPKHYLYQLFHFCFLDSPVPEDGETPMELSVYDFKGPGIALAMYNVDEVYFCQTA